MCHFVIKNFAKQVLKAFWRLKIPSKAQKATYCTTGIWSFESMLQEIF